MKKIFCWVAASLLSLSVFAQRIHYLFTAPNAVHHEAEISLTANGLPLTPAVFKMSRSSPGRYAKHEFGKNVYNVKAYDAKGKALKLEKEDADVYKVSNHKGVVKLTYTLFGNHADGTYSAIDISGYHLNMPATFMWVKGLENAPITLQFSVPVQNWTVATQLKPGADPHSFTAPGLQYFMDAPTKVGNLHLREWKVKNNDNKEYSFRLALDANASEGLVNTFTEKLKKVVEAGRKVYGDFPDYDYGSYTFIASINPFVKGDGMEHRNSTMITIPTEFDGRDELLGVFAHEFFHCWNVERIRPKSLEPFNFEKSNMSEALWVAEGFTHYYGDVLLVRAGFLTHDEFVNEMSKLVNAKTNTPGALLYSPVESSQRAVFTDAGVSIDATNYQNMFTSYYTYGGAIALALDLELRSRFSKSLDDVMKLLWKKYGKTEIPYTLTDVQNAVTVVVGSTAYASNFFSKYVYGHEPLDFKTLFSAANYSVNIINKGKAWLGSVALDSFNNGVIVKGNTVQNTPLYKAGIDVNDIITEMDGRKLTTTKDVDAILQMHKPGDSLALTFIHRYNTINTTVALAEDPWLQIDASEKEGGTITAKQQQLRREWMGEGKK
jgi:predicted metalloprotease with PDZ domain